MNNVIHSTGNNDINIIIYFLLLQDLDRQVVKQESATFSIPELSFEIPPFMQKGGMYLFWSVLMIVGANQDVAKPKKKKLTNKKKKK